eukprot:5663675-Alexandrium_andersonii.AAC.1
MGKVVRRNGRARTRPSLPRLELAGRARARGRSCERASGSAAWTMALGQERVLPFLSRFQRFNLLQA